jgi:hypothetical protein
MDKWKEMEIEKMKVGGNRKAKEFFANQSDYNASTMSLQQRYNSRAAALYRDKIVTEAQGKTWSINSSSAQNHSSPYASSSSINYTEKPSKVNEIFKKIPCIFFFHLKSISQRHRNGHNLNHPNRVMKIMVDIKIVVQMTNNILLVLAVVIQNIGVLEIQIMMHQHKIKDRILIYLDHRFPVWVPMPLNWRVLLKIRLLKYRKQQLTKLRN